MTSVELPRLSDNSLLSDCQGMLSHICRAEAVVVLDGGLQIQYVNAVAEDIFGYTNREIKNGSIHDILPRLTLDQRYLEINAKHHRAYYFPVTVTLLALKSPLYLGVVRDISRQKFYMPTQTPIDVLSPRQREILWLVVQGYTSREIAQQLSISIKTVETHRNNIMNRLEVTNLVELVRIAIRYGFIMA